MQFVIRVTAAHRHFCWLGEQSVSGIRQLAIREDAVVFATRQDAESAIEEMPDAFDLAGMVFSVESAN
jgi:hypothetical protein